VECGRELAAIQATKLWSQRAGAPYKSFEDFVRQEFGRSAKWAYGLIAVAASFTEADVIAHGVAKLRLLASVPEGEQPKVRALIDSGARRDEVAASVREIKARTGFQKESVGKTSIPTNAGKSGKREVVWTRVLPPVPTETRLEDMSVEQLGETFGIAIAKSDEELRAEERRKLVEKQDREARERVEARVAKLAAGPKYHVVGLFAETTRKVTLSARGPVEWSEESVDAEYVIIHAFAGDWPNIIYTRRIVRADAEEQT
jgi:hypothetical protein